jgi:hypothetical protein
MRIIGCDLHARQQTFGDVGHDNGSRVGGGALTRWPPSTISGRIPLATKAV